MGYNQEDTYLSIKEWREDEKPREKLIKHGGKSLSDSELIAILIGSGTKRYSALDCAKELLKNHNNLSELSTQDISSFTKIKGIGVAKAVSLLSAFEIVKRVKVQPFNKNDTIDGPEMIAKRYLTKYHGIKKEVFWVLILDTKNQIIREVIISEGILDSTVVHPREVFRIAILESAASIVLMHNHPSGSVEPSIQDKNLTTRLSKAGELIGIKILDHIIVGGDDYYSFVEQGILQAT